MFLLVPAYPGCPGQKPLNGCVCVCVSLIVRQLCTGNSILFKLQVDVSDLSSAGLLAYQWQWLGLMNDSVSVC